MLSPGPARSRRSKTNQDEQALDFDKEKLFSSKLCVSLVKIDVNPAMVNKALNMSSKKTAPRKSAKNAKAESPIELSSDDAPLQPLHTLRTRRNQHPKAHQRARFLKLRMTLM